MCSSYPSVRYGRAPLSTISNDDDDDDDDEAKMQEMQKKL